MKISILGCKISALSSYEEAYRKLLQYLTSESSSAYITVNNVHTVVEAILNKDYQAIINKAFLSFPDGRPVSVIAEWKGRVNVGRIFGPSFFEKTLEWGQENGLRHYFWGGNPQTLQKLKKVIEEKYPKVTIAGMVSPPFRPVTAKENNIYLDKMNDSVADIFWIALGAPKQEIWIYENYGKLNSGVMIGIGAAFDYLAGNTKHSPQWMKKMALEWLFRLFQEPKRLWKRYLITNSLFILFAFF